MKTIILVLFTSKKHDMNSKIKVSSFFVYFLFLLHWCNKQNVSHFTFFHLFNIENDWIFHVKESSFETRVRRQFKFDVENALNKEIKEEIKERIQEYCKGII